MMSFRDFDWVLLGVGVLISLMGVTEIYRTTYGTKFAAGPGAPPHIRQLYWIMGGLTLMFMVSLFNYQLLLENAHWFYVASILALLAVTFFGTKNLGARRWIRLPGGQHFQPSEWVKLVVILALPQYFSRSNDAWPSMPDAAHALLI